MRLLFAFTLSLLWVMPGRAQERVRNVRLRVVAGAQLEIQYDLVTIRPGDSVYVQVESRPRGSLLILPEFIRGDLGKRVTAGNDRRVVWDAVANGYSLNEEIRATVSVKATLPARSDPAFSSTPKPTATPAESATSVEQKTQESEMRTSALQPKPRNETSGQSVETDQATTSRKTRYSGPAWALLSVVAPGMGNVFVQTPKPRIGLRPLITIGCYGLVAYGLAERQKSLDAYAIYEQQKNVTAGEPYYQTANNHHHNYFLMTRGAIVVAAADVVLTFLRGLRNSRLQKAKRMEAVSVGPGVQAGQPTAIVRYSF